MERLETAQQIRGIRVFQVIGEGIALWRHEFLSFSAIYLVIGIPTALLTLPLLRSTQTTSTLPMNLFLYTVIFILGMWGSVALITATEQAANGDKVQVLKNLEGAWGYFVRYAGVVILTYLLFIAIFLLMILGIFLVGIILALLLAKLHGVALIISVVVGVATIVALAISGICYSVYFGIRLSLGIYTCVLEDKGPVNSLKRSFFLVKQHVNPVVGVFFALLVGTGILYLPSMLFNFVVTYPKQLNMLTTILQCAAGLIAMPISKTILVNLYQRLKELSV